MDLIHQCIEWAEQSRECNELKANHRIVNSEHALVDVKFKPENICSAYRGQQINYRFPLALTE